VRELLEGRRIGFALRPPLAYVATGLGIAATLLDLMGWFAWGSRETNGFVVAAYWMVAAAAVVGLLGLVTALAEMVDVPDEERTLARLDVAAAAVVTILYAASATLRAFDLGAAGVAPLALLLAVAGLAVLLVGSGISSLLYAAREWEEIEDLSHERHRRRRAVAR
jgi:hypothetical protein